MLQLKRKSGFTLIELLVVVIIVAVLAAVGIPLLSAEVERAKVSELEAGLGTIRTAMRAEFAENGSTVGWSNVTLSDLVTVAPEIGLAVNDLDGRFALQSEYTIVSADADSYSAAVSPAGAAPKGADLVNIDRSISGCAGAGCTTAQNDGDIFDDAACAGNKLN